MIAIYNPNSDPTLQNLPLPTDTEIAEFEDIAGFLELLDTKRNQIEQIILSNGLLFQGEGYATPENIATIKRLFPHTNHHRQIIRSTYGNKFSGKNVYDNGRNEPDYDIRGARMIAKLLVKNYSNTSPNDVGDLVGKFAGKVNFLFHSPISNGPYYEQMYMDILYRYFHGLDISINNQKLS